MRCDGILSAGKEGGISLRSRTGTMYVEHKKGQLTQHEGKITNISRELWQDLD